MRLRLALAMSRHAGQPLTQDLARQILDEACPPGGNPISLEQFKPEQWAGYTIQTERIAGQERALWELECQFRREVGLDDDLNPAVHAASLRDDEAAGLLLLVVARDSGGELAGIMRIRVWSQLSVPVIQARDDLLYVVPQHRTGWLGLHLARYAETCAFGLGARDFTLTCQDATDSGRLARFAGYSHVADIYKKVAQDACDFQLMPTRHRKGVAHEPLAPQ